MPNDRKQKRPFRKSFASIGDVLREFRSDEDKYVSREFQKYGYDLAKELNDLKHKALYIKLSKTTSRVLLENARNFVKDASNVRNKGRLFMWKLSKLRSEAVETKMKQNLK